MIREKIVELVSEALDSAQDAGEIPHFVSPEITIEHPQRIEHGDFSINLPLRIQGLAKMKALDIANILQKHIESYLAIEKIEVAHPGFLNFYLEETWVCEQIALIINAGDSFAFSDIGNGIKVQIEYVSANPTGPIHVGNGRGAAIGSTLANVMNFLGFNVQQEYYVNDAGTQVSIFGKTLYARYAELFGKEVQIPDNGYPGEYIIELAKNIQEQYGDAFLELINNEPNPELGKIGINLQLTDIKDDLTAIGVNYDSWFSEQSLMDKGGAYEVSLQLLMDADLVLEREGAVWFNSSDLGESKDNVLIRSDGQPTYYATDVAYHYDKFLIRKFERVIDIWGADHQGHVSRVKTALQTVGGDPDSLDVLLYQLVNLRRGNEIVPLSKRAGEIVTLRNVIDEVGADAARFFFLSSSANQTMDFDLELAKSQSDENPLYYVQYAHARISSILSKAEEDSLFKNNPKISLLNHPSEQLLIRKLLLLPEILENVITDLAPHHLPHYSKDLATAFHSFYTQCRVISEDKDLTAARLMLLQASQIVLAKTLALMGISAPRKM